MYQNYIFDLYGTLVDIRTNENSPYLWRKMGEFYSALGAVYTARELKAEYRRLVEAAMNMAGKAAEPAENVTETAEETVNKALKEEHIEPDLTEVFAELYRQRGVACDRNQARMTAIMFRTLSRSKLCLYDGVTDFLEKLKAKGKGVYLLSNAQEDFTRPEIDMLGLEKYFDGIFISSEQGVKKPSPLFYKKLLEKYGLDLAASVMIGNDAEADIRGAQAVGLSTLYIHTAISPELKGEVNADYLVMDGDFRKIEKLILKD